MSPAPRGRRDNSMRGLFAIGLGLALGVTVAVIFAAREPAPATTTPVRTEGA